MYYFEFSVIIIKNPIRSPALAKIQCLYFASRWWSLSSQSSAALHCPSSWWNKISRLFPFTEEWPRRRGETLISSLYTSSHQHAQLMPSVFMKHEALPDKSTRALVSSVGDSLHLCPIWSPFYCRLSRYQQFKDFQRRILVATNLFGRGMDIERVNIVFNYDMPEDSDTYLHRVGI